MSKRRWRVWLRPPIARVAGVQVVLACMLLGCSGARLVASPGASDPSVEPTNTQPIDVRPQAADLVGRTWLAEGPRGWEAGRIGGRSISLGRAEVGLAARGRWIVSAILQPTDAVALLFRDGPAAEPKRLDLGSLAPTTTAIVGNRAYVSGFSFAEQTDPGILEIDLEASTVRAVLPPSKATGTRYLTASADGSTLVSSLCDQVADPEPPTCSMTVISLRDGTATLVGDVRGGLPRATSAEVAVVAPQSHEAPQWLAGIDLTTGAELWRLAGGEFGASVMHERLGLIQQRILLDGPQPRLVIEAVELRTGTTQLVYEEARPALGALWPELCSDRFIVVGDDATGSRALGESADGRTRVRLVPLDAGDPVDVSIMLRSGR